jgi:hypothetical protein
VNRYDVRRVSYAAIWVRAREGTAAMETRVIENLQARTHSKLRYAEVHLAEIEGRKHRNGDDFDRAHQESFLFHLSGSLDAFLAEINCYYACNLPAAGISPGNLRKAIKGKRGENAPELAQLYQIERLQGSWLNHANAMRDHSTHGAGVPRVINLGGEKDGEVWLRNPESGHVIEQDYPAVFRGWLEEASEVISRWRMSALAQMDSLHTQPEELGSGIE